MNSWHRIDGPTKDDPYSGEVGDDARGDHMWRSLYGRGRARAEVIHYLAAHDIMEEWGNDDDDEGSRVAIMEVTHTWVVDDNGDPSEDDGYDYDYESVGLYDYELQDAERAYRALDATAAPDMSWAFCGPDEKAPEVYERAPHLHDWDWAMKAEEILDSTAR